MKSFTFLFAALVAVFGTLGTSPLFISKAHAWGDVGHQTVALIAEQNLTPETRKAVEQILGIGPLASAAIFPDTVRSDSRFNGFSPYHFLEVYPGQKDFDSQPKEIMAKRDGATVIRQFPSIFLDEKMGLFARMLALRYYIHVVGDVHQPLHVGNGVDLGANLCQVKWSLTGEKPEHSITDLHSVWDEKVIDYLKLTLREPGASKRYFGYAEFAKLITKKFEARDPNPENIHAAPEVWFAQAVALRKSDVYPDSAQLAALPTNKDFLRPYCGLRGDLVKRAQSRTELNILKEVGYTGDLDVLASHQLDPSQIPELTPAYADRALELIESQIYIAGLRLAHQLNTYFANPKAYVANEKAFDGFTLKDLVLDSR